MTDKLIEQIKADRDAGTPGPWRIQDCESYGYRCKTFFKEVWNDETDILVTTEVTRLHTDGGTANMRRIARVPEYEARILADEQALKEANEAVKAAEAKVARLRAVLQWQVDLIDKTVTPNGTDVARLQLDSGSWHTGPVVDWVHTTLKGWSSIARAAMTEENNDDE